MNRADEQARDTTRKHHLQDLETSLYAVRMIHNTYPPYEMNTWCGQLNDPKNSDVRSQIELALRNQNDKYANLAKPFPTDPAGNFDYFYWKKSANIFELYAKLENDSEGSFSTKLCPGEADRVYNYGLNSALRENNRRYDI